MEIAYLGVDGGGTSLRASMISEMGGVLSTYSGNSANPISVGEFEAFNNLKVAVENCLIGANQTVFIQDATFALAGTSTRKIAQQMYRKIIESNLRDIIKGQIFVTNDTMAALWEGATRWPAIAIVAGTGSHCLGISKFGRVTRASGLEYILSDEGGAYYLGDRVLRSITKACDNRGEQTLLKELIFSKVGISSISELFEYIHSATSVKQTVASFAVFASEAAEQGDKIAIDIVNNGVLSLVDAIKAVRSSLSIEDDSFEIVAIGGVFNSDIYRNMLINKITLEFPLAEMKFLRPNASIGAAKMARDKPDYDIWSCYE